MKKQIVLATIATLATGSVYATKARMQALGQGQDRGSFYIDDTRNVFRNAASINKTNNYMVTEWGTAAAADDTSAAPSAEGGFFRNGGSFNYGLYLGADVDSQNDIRNGGNGYAGAVAMGETSLLKRDNELDLFFGGDMGVEWGARLSYANSSADVRTPFVGEQKQSSLGLGLGMIMGDLNAYANIGLSDESEGGNLAADKWEADTSIDAGAAYNWMGYTFFANYNTDGAKYTNAATAAVETSQTDLTFGVGHIKEVSSTSRMFMDVSYFNRKAEDKSTTTTEVTTSALPVTVGFETDATSWLTLRGSISQRVLINSVETKTTTTTKATGANNTNVEAGMTLNFGKLMIDGVIGNTGINGSTAGSEVGALSLDRLATRVAVHYWF